MHSQADAWLSANDELFVADLSGVRTRAALPGDTSSTPVRLSYADLSLTWRHDRGGLAVGATAGVRHGVAGIDGTRGWGSVDATAWVSDHEALVLSGGTTLADAVRGVPATRYVSAAIRFAVRPHPSLDSHGHRALAALWLRSSRSAAASSRSRCEPPQDRGSS